MPALLVSALLFPLPTRAAPRYARAYDALLARFSEICISTFPDRTALAALFNRLGLHATDVQLPTHPGAADLRAVHGPLGAGPNPAQPLDVTISNNPHDGCGVATTERSPAAGDDTRFEKLVRAFAAARPDLRVQAVHLPALTLSPGQDAVRTDLIAGRDAVEQFLYVTRPGPGPSARLVFLSRLSRNRNPT